METSGLLSLVQTMAEAGGEPFFAIRDAYRCYRRPLRSPSIPREKSWPTRGHISAHIGLPVLFTSGNGESVTADLERMVHDLTGRKD